VSYVSPVTVAGLGEKLIEESLAGRDLLDGQGPLFAFPLSDAL
jgi:hypothetical protein